MQLFIALLASCASVFAAPAASDVHVIEGYQLCRPSEVGFKIQQLSITPTIYLQLDNFGWGIPTNPKSPTFSVSLNIPAYETLSYNPLMTDK